MNQNPLPALVRCKVCGDEFHPRTRNHAYCTSPECQRVKNQRNHDRDRDKARAKR